MTKHQTTSGRPGQKVECASRSSATPGNQTIGGAGIQRAALRTLCKKSKSKPRALAEKDSGCQHLWNREPSIIRPRTLFGTASWQYSVAAVAGGFAHRHGKSTHRQEKSSLRGSGAEVKSGNTRLRSSQGCYPPVWSNPSLKRRTNGVAQSPGHRKWATHLWPGLCATPLVLRLSEGLDHTAG